MFSIVFSLCCSCRVTRHSTTHVLRLMDDYCQPRIALENHPFNLHNKDSLLIANTFLRKSLSVHSILMSDATGTLPLVTKLLTSSGDTSAEKRMEKMQVLHQFQQKITLARLQIESIAAELDCEAERTNRIINYLNNKGSERTNKLTVAAIIAGSVTTLIPILIKDNRPQNAAVITGAAISVLVGVAALKPNPNTVNLTYTRNLLSDIWYAKDPMGFPEFIWLMLATREFNYDQQISIRENLKKRWLKLEFNSSIDTKTEKLLFSNGGVFSSNDLQTRYNLLKQTQAAIMLMSKDVETFLEEVYQLYDNY